MNHLFNPPFNSNNISHSIEITAIETYFILIFFERAQFLQRNSQHFRRGYVFYNMSSLLAYTCMIVHWVQNIVMCRCVEKHLRQNYTLWNLNLVVFLNFTLVCGMCVSMCVCVCLCGISKTKCVMYVYLLYARV